MYLLTKKDPYTAIRNLVVKDTNMSDYQRLENLHTLPALGDQQPPLASSWPASATSSQRLSASVTVPATSSSTGCLQSRELN